MNDPTCSQCKHYLLHYILRKSGDYIRINCGHCKHPRIKHRKPDTLACVYFEAEESDNIPANIGSCQAADSST